MLLSEITTREQLAAALGVSFKKHIVYYLYRLPDASRYRTFQISKRSGGSRTLHAPHHGLKAVQKRLALLLEESYGKRGGVHGYVKGRSIITNASQHIRQRHVLNIDLLDFFGSITFPRIRGLLLSSMYGASEEVATVIAQLCCFQSKLPQGAPTSPVISNMICGKMDAALKQLASEFSCTYTRYSDDISFSTTKAAFPEPIATAIGSGADRKVVLGQRLLQIIAEGGFSINEKKSRLLTRSDRQDVTGLVTNRFVNVPREFIKNIRGALHSWERDGQEKASAQFVEKYDTRSRGRVDLDRVLAGRIQYVGKVRGYDDEIYRKLLVKYNSLAERKIPPHENSWEFKLENAIWVLEYDVADDAPADALGQGTAFFAANIGIITCAHCIQGDENFIYHPDNRTTKHYVDVVSIDHDVDLALLKFRDQTLSPVAEFKVSADRYEAQRGDRITLAGWPGYGPGNQLTVKYGQVNSIKMFHGIRRINVSTPINAGNSGGPVFNVRGEIIGVAAKGGNETSPEGQTEDHSVIPINALRHLKQVDAL